MGAKFVELAGKPMTRKDLEEFFKHPMFHKPLSARPLTLEEVFGHTPTQEEIDALNAIACDPVAMYDKIIKDE